MNIAYLVGTILFLFISEFFYSKTRNSPFFYLLWGIFLPFRVTSNWPIYTLLVLSILILTSLGAVAKRNRGGETETPGAQISTSGFLIGLVIGGVIQFF